MLNRAIFVTTPLGPETLLFDRMTGSERLGMPFRYELELLSKVAEVDLDKLLGKPVTVHVDLPPPQPFRFFNGIVTNAAFAGLAGEYFRFRLILEPWFSLLNLTARSRIFQNKSVPDIVKEIFREHGFSDFRESLSGSYSPWEYLVQYRESDFSFVSRMLEQEGIYFFFEHAEGKHVMVLADSSSAHQPADGYDEIPFYPPQEGARREKEHFLHWNFAKEIQPGAFASRDFDFERPRADLTVRRSSPKSHAHAGYEVYDAPGEYRTQAQGDQIALIRLQELQADYAPCEATGNTRGIGCGHTFKLTNFPRADQNKEYLVVTASYTMSGTQFMSGQRDAQQDFQCHFDVIDHAVQFRTPRKTPKPFVQGPQTATVVGKSGEEIWTDKYGRVKVQFHWDREGKRDESSSCWVRVSQVWAGTGWGAMHIPRIGQEVIVDFLEGDPDQPIITGRVYNGANMPPYGLPANQTQSGIKSRSTKGGGVDNFNELRFEDKKGEEHVYFQAEKDLESLVKNDEKRTVGHDRVTEIKNDETVTVDGNRTETVKKNETISIEGNRTESVTKNETISIDGNRTESVKKNETISVEGARTTAITKDETLSVDGARTTDVKKDETLAVDGKRTTTVKKDEELTVSGKRVQTVEKDDVLKVSKKMLLDAGDEIVIKAGSASITMKKDGSVVIKGKDITLDGSGKINAKASGDVVLKGSKVTQN